MQAARVNAVVEEARRRLAGAHVVASLRRHLVWVTGAAAMAAVARPLVWPLGEAPTWRAALRCAVLAAAGASVAIVVVSARAWRTRPSALSAARRVDAALGEPELVASAWAFAQGRADGMTALAIDRAARKVEGLRLGPALRTAGERLPRSALIGLGALVLALAFGGVDRVAVARALHPPTARETGAAKALAAAADKAEQGAKAKEPSKEEKALVEAAKRAAAATERGDRTRAMDQLDEMRRAERALEQKQRAEARALRKVREEAQRAGERGAGSASESLSELAKDAASAEGPRAVEERIARAEAAAREAASSRPEWEKAAAALAEAKAAMARGDRAGAARALEQARSEVAALEKKASEERETLSRMSARASELDRSLRGDPEPGRPGGEPKEGGGAPGKGESPAKGEGKGEGDSQAQGDPEGAPGRGPGEGKRDPGAEGRRAAISGDLQARADVKPGVKAVRALEGMGQGGDPKEFREIFPSYATVVEDGLRDDAVPAARRPTVRRYFSSIRPGSEPAETPRETP